MKALILLSILSICGSIASSQNSGCKLQTNTVDKFTGVRLLVVEPQVVWRKGALLSRVDAFFVPQIIGDVKVIQVALHCNKTSDYDWFDSFSSALLMSESGQVVSLIPNDRCNYLYAGDSDWVLYWQHYTVDDSTWQVLSTFQVSAARVYIQNPHAYHFIDMDIKTKNKSILADGIQCLNAHLTRQHNRKD